MLSTPHPDSAHLATRISVLRSRLETVCSTLAEHGDRSAAALARLGYGPDPLDLVFVLAGVGLLTYFKHVQSVLDAVLVVAGYVVARLALVAVRRFRLTSLMERRERAAERLRQAIADLSLLTPITDSTPGRLMEVMTPALEACASVSAQLERFVMAPVIAPQVMQSLYSAARASRDFTALASAQSLAMAVPGASDVPEIRDVLDEISERSSSRLVAAVYMSLYGDRSASRRVLSMLSDETPTGHASLVSAWKLPGFVEAMGVLENSDRPCATPLEAWRYFIHSSGLSLPDLAHASQMAAKSSLSPEEKASMRVEIWAQVEAAVSSGVEAAFCQNIRDHRKSGLATAEKEKTTRRIVFDRFYIPQIEAAEEEFFRASTQPDERAHTRLGFALARHMPPSP